MAKKILSVRDPYSYFDQEGSYAEFLRMILGEAGIDTKICHIEELRERIGQTLEFVVLNVRTPNLQYRWRFGSGGVNEYIFRITQVLFSDICPSCWIAIINLDTSELILRFDNEDPEREI